MLFDLFHFLPAMESYSKYEHRAIFIRNGNGYEENKITPWRDPSHITEDYLKYGKINKNTYI